MFMDEFSSLEFRRSRGGKSRRRSLRDRLLGTTGLGRSLRLAGVGATGGLAGLALSRRKGRASTVYRKTSNNLVDRVGRRTQQDFRSAQRAESRRAGAQNASVNRSRQERGLNRLPGTVQGTYGVQQKPAPSSPKGRKGSQAKDFVPTWSGAKRRSMAAKVRKTFNRKGRK